MEPFLGGLPTFLVPHVSGQGCGRAGASKGDAGFAHQQQGVSYVAGGTRR